MITSSKNNKVYDIGCKHYILRQEEMIKLYNK